MNIGILGGGTFGMALAVHLAKRGYGIRIFEIDQKRVDGINNGRHDLLNSTIPDNIHASSEISVVYECPVVLVAVPSPFVISVCKDVKQFLENETIVVCCSKGFHDNDILYNGMKKVLNNKIAVLSGPSHAEELVKGKLTGVTIASENNKVNEELQHIFSSENFVVECSDDPVGVQLAAGFKNILAILAGVISGKNMGSNAEAYWLTKGFQDLVAFTTALGGQQETCYSLAGFGDVIVTCTGSLSRNRKFGRLIVEGCSKEEALKEVGQVVEGITALSIVKELCEKKNLSLPTVDLLSKIIEEGDVSNLSF